MMFFSSSGLSNLSVRIGLPPIPMVPVSSSQVIVGCVIGIGLYKGARNINFKLLGEIALGWLATPIMSGFMTFFSLFFIKNIFGIDVGHKMPEGVKETLSTSLTPDAAISDMIRYILLGIVIIGVIIGAYYILFERKKNRELRVSEEKFWKNIK